MPETLGTFLKKLRCERHLTQTQVAVKLGITRQAYGYYEKHNTLPDLEILLKLASFYDISISRFMDYCPPETSSQIAEAGHYEGIANKTNIYPEYLSFFSEHDNMKKYHHLNNSEKKLLFMFQKLSEDEQLELLQWAYYKSTTNPDTEFLPAMKK